MPTGRREPVSLTPGARLGVYRIEAPLGAGGMGEVYRARDTRLDRDVAVKVLPARLAESSDALARFEREAKAVASLSHPGILAIHDFGREDATSFAVMELLEGATLRERLRDGPLPLRKAADYAAQIAHALAAAHARGVVHRDLKPENLFVTADGRVKVLDFGLARQDASQAGSEDTHSPTLERATDPGSVLGTVGYMSPEQVRGQTADARSDIFSMGAVLYEMLTGRRAFQRETAAETMTAILREDPVGLSDSSSASLPAGLVRLVSRCLEKSPEERFQSARDLAFALEGATSSTSARVEALDGPRRSSPSWTRALPLAWLLLGALGGAVLALRFGAPPPTEPPRTRPLTFSGSDRDPAASPDGRLLAFASARDGTSRIWIKQLQGGGEAPLTAGDDRYPRFSPDGSSVLFIRLEGEARSAYRIGLVGGEPRKLAEDVFQADWMPDGQQIAFMRLRRANAEAASGGTPAGSWVVGLRELASGRERELYSLRDNAPMALRVSPDGHTLAMIEGPAFLNTRFALTLVDTATGSARQGAAPGYPVGCLAWAAGNRVTLARADSALGDAGGPGRVFLLGLDGSRERTLLFTSGLFPLAGSVEARNGTCDVLGPGRLVLDQFDYRMNLSEVSATPDGAPPRVLTSGNTRDRQPVYSPDGSRIAFSSNRSGNLDLWLLETRTGALRQVTDDPAQDWDPGFTPDGKQLLWSSDRSGNLEIWIAGTDGSGARQLTHDGVDAENPTMTRDGRYVVYTSGNPKQPGVWRIRPDGSDGRRIVEGAALVPQVSPDGRHVLFVANAPTADNRLRLVKVAEVESGALVPFGIEVRSPATATNQILDGRARFAPDGRSILFVAANADGRYGVYSQEFAPGRDTQATRRVVTGFAPDVLTESLGLSPDGKRLTVSTMQQFASLQLAEGLAGLEPPRR
jgi:eukaryotic-like serine/threonine-protein kinase